MYKTPRPGATWVRFSQAEPRKHEETRSTRPPLCSPNARLQMMRGSRQTVLLARRAPTIKRWSLDARSEEQSAYSLWGSWGVRRPSPGLMARPGVPVGGRVRKSRAVGDQPAHPFRDPKEELGRFQLSFPTEQACEFRFSGGSPRQRPDTPLSERSMDQIAYARHMRRPEPLRKPRRWLV